MKNLNSLVSYENKSDNKTNSIEFISPSKLSPQKAVKIHCDIEKVKSNARKIENKVKEINDKSEVKDLVFFIGKDLYISSFYSDEVLELSKYIYYTLGIDITNAESGNGLLFSDSLAESVSEISDYSTDEAQFRIELSNENGSKASKEDVNKVLSIIKSYKIKDDKIDKFIFEDKHFISFILSKKDFNKYQKIVADVIKLGKLYDTGIGFNFEITPELEEEVKKLIDAVKKKYKDELFSTFIEGKRAASDKDDKKRYDQYKNKKSDWGYPMVNKYGVYGKTSDNLVVCVRVPSPDDRDGANVNRSNTKKIISSGEKIKGILMVRRFDAVSGRTYFEIEGENEDAIMKVVKLIKIMNIDVFNPVYYKYSSKQQARSMKLADKI